MKGGTVNIGGEKYNRQSDGSWNSSKGTLSGDQVLTKINDALGWSNSILGMDEFKYFRGTVGDSKDDDNALTTSEISKAVRNVDDDDAVKNLKGLVSEDLATITNPGQWAESIKIKRKSDDKEMIFNIKEANIEQKILNFINGVNTDWSK